MNRNKQASPAQTENEKALMQDVLDLTTENSELLHTIRMRNIAIGAWATFAAIAGLMLIILSIQSVNLNAALNVAEDNAYAFERKSYILERELSLYEREAAAKAVAAAETLVRAQEECARQVEASMADVTTDSFGNPVDVSEFAWESCESELQKSGRGNFLERFTPSA